MALTTYLSSTKNVKKNITDLDSETSELIYNLKPRRFDYKDEHLGSDIGFIAEEAEQIYPMFATLNENKEPINIHWNAITASSIKEIQKLKDKLDNLKLFDKQIKLGINAGESLQNEHSIAIGTNAGNNNQRKNSIAIGINSGKNNQSDNSISIGKNSGSRDQNTHSIAIGINSGETRQGSDNISIGTNSASQDQQFESIAIGKNSGKINQQRQSIAIGSNSAINNQGINSIAIGHNAGETDQGSNSIAIGENAGIFRQHNNSIILNSSENSLNSNNPGLFIKPIRSHINTHSLKYNSETGEISYEDYSRENKQEIRNINQNHLDIIDKISAREFRYKDSYQKDIGLIAEEMQYISDDIILKENGYAKNIKWNTLISLLCERSKIQKIEIENLKKEIHYMKKKI